MSSTTTLETFRSSCCFSSVTGTLYLVDFQREHPDDPAAYPPPCLRGGPPCDAARAFASAFFSPPPGPPAFELYDPGPFVMYDPGPFDLDALVRSLDDGLTIDERLESFKTDLDELFRPFGDDPDRHDD